MKIQMPESIDIFALVAADLPGLGGRFAIAEVKSGKPQLTWTVDAQTAYVESPNATRNASRCGAGKPSSPSSIGAHS